MYIKEAHPTNEWQMDSNEDEGVCYAQPRTLADRVAIARDFKRRFEFPIPMLVDGLENETDIAYGAWPERLYIIDEAGKVVYKGKMGPFGFDPAEAEAWLQKRFPRTNASPLAAQTLRVPSAVDSAP